MRAVVEVTPAGHNLRRWASVRAGAVRLTLAELAEELDLERGAELVVFGAHPDDETLGLGRLIHAWAHRLGLVTAVVATAGEACLDHVGPRIPGLAQRRLAEWVTATDILGVGDQTPLGLADGTLTDQESTLSSMAERLLASRTGSLTRPVLAAPWRHDPHPDHRALGRVIGSLGRSLGLPVLEFGVWMTYWSDPDELAADGRRLAVLSTNYHDELAFDRACKAFDSQLSPLVPGWGPVVPPAMLAHLQQQLLVLPQEHDR
jgi:LmbE family N-acetylglucosaminyl deacetylase